MWWTVHEILLSRKLIVWVTVNETGQIFPVGIPVHEEELGWILVKIPVAMSLGRTYWGSKSPRKSKRLKKIQRRTGYSLYDCVFGRRRRLGKINGTCSLVEAYGRSI